MSLVLCTKACWTRREWPNKIWGVCSRVRNVLHSRWKLMIYLGRLFYHNFQQLIQPLCQILICIFILICIMFLRVVFYKILKIYKNFCIISACYKIGLLKYFFGYSLIPYWSKLNLIRFVSPYDSTTFPVRIWLFILICVVFLLVVFYKILKII